VERKAHELEGAAKKGDVGSLYKHLRDLKGDIAPLGCICCLCGWPAAQ
jgi:hypothetical protein